MLLGVIHALETVGENSLAEKIRKIHVGDMRLATNISLNKMKERVNDSLITELGQLSKSFAWRNLETKRCI